MMIKILEQSPCQLLIDNVRLAKKKNERENFRWLEFIETSKCFFFIDYRESLSGLYRENKCQTQEPSVGACMMCKIDFCP